VIIRIPVTLEMMVVGKKVSVRATTVSVNDHGAMLLCTRNFVVDARFELVNDRTDRRQSCRVTRAAVDNQGGYLIPVEFGQPVPGFWHISFPPPGWKSVEN
jgi:hypothetical protein